jgi:hypothetical protein
MGGYLKPLTRWVITRRYSVRFTERSRQRVTGLLSTPTGTETFVYYPAQRMIEFAGEQIQIDEYGWEIKAAAS